MTSLVRVRINDELLTILSGSLCLQDVIGHRSPSLYPFVFYSGVAERLQQKDNELEDYRMN